MENILLVGHLAWTSPLPL